jgi:hypothetical protein
MRFSSATVSHSHPVLKEFACVNCHGDAIRVVLVMERSVHLQCDDCSEQSTMPERRVSERG